MAILLLTLLGTIAVIYGVSYREMSQENRSMLELYAREYLENGGLPDTDVDEDGSGNMLADERYVDEEPTDDEVSEDGWTVSELSEEESSETIDEASSADASEYRKIVKEDSFAVSGSALGDSAGTDGTYSIFRRRLELSTFYSVVFSADGSVLQVNNDDPSQMSDEVLTELAQSFLETGKSYGI